MDEDPPVLLNLTLGNKLYEMSNHLGNVLTVINDIKVPYLEQDNVLFKATIMRTYDYSPFGVQLDERSDERMFCESETNEVTVTDLDNNFNGGTTQGWAQTSVPATVLTNSNNRLRIRRRESHATYTPTDNWDTGIPIDAHKTVQLTEGVLYSFSALVDRNTCTGITIRVRLVDSDGNDVIQPILANPSGITAISFSYTPQQTGNYKLIFEGVESTILCNFNVDDILITHQETVTSQVNCVGVEGYRYGFQGQEKDDEIKGAGNSVNYTFRMHDPRLGRFFAVDPLSPDYPMLTPYQFSSNSPMYMIELEGLEGVVCTQGATRNLVYFKAYNNPNGRPTVQNVNQNNVIFIFANTVGGMNSITRPLTTAELTDPFISNNQVNANARGAGSNRTTASPNAPLTFFSSSPRAPDAHGVADLRGVLGPANQSTTTVTSDFGVTPATTPSGGATQSFNIPIVGGANNCTITLNGNPIAATSPLGSLSNTFTITDDIGNTYLTNFNPNAGLPMPAVTLAPGATSLTVTVTGAANTQLDSFTFQVTTSGPNNTATNIAPVQVSIATPIPSSASSMNSVTTISTTGVSVNTNVQSATSNNAQPLNPM